MLGRPVTRIAASTALNFALCFALSSCSGNRGPASESTPAIQESPATSTSVPTTTALATPSAVPVGATPESPLSNAPASTASTAPRSDGPAVPSSLADYWGAYPPVTSCSVNGAEAVLTTADGLTIRGPFARPAGASSAPGVLVLHTRGGLGGHERAAVAWLTEAGFAAFAPDYFGPLSLRPLAADDRDLVQKLLAGDGDRIRGVLARSLDCLLSLPRVAPGQAGVVGFSLGGGFAFDLATHPRVRAIVPWYSTDLALAARPGGPTRAQAMSQMRASALILAGETDSLFRVDQSLHENLLRAGKSSAFVSYPGVGHGWDQPASQIYTYSASATDDARSRTSSFLKSSLQ